MTRRQRDLLRFITWYMKREGMAPSLQDMAAGIKLRSVGSIHRLLTALREQEYVSWLPRRARSLQVLRQPGDMRPFCPKCGGGMVVESAGARFVGKVAGQA